MEPIYRAHQSPHRAMLPKLLWFLLLSAIFYAGILLNINLLELSASEDTFVQIVSLLILLIIIGIGCWITHKRANVSYEFYPNKLVFGTSTLPYQDIIYTHAKKDLFDKLFKTYHINLSKNFHLRHIHQSQPLEAYITKLQQYARSHTSPATPASQTTTTAQ